MNNARHVALSHIAFYDCLACAMLCLCYDMFCHATNYVVSYTMIWVYIYASKPRN